MITVIGGVTKEDLENEVRAFEEFLKVVHHPNIIHVLDRGWYNIPITCHFIDMELCDLDLNEYIHKPASRVSIVQALTGVSHNPNDFAFIQTECPPLNKIRNVWAIVRDIAHGLEEIHRHNLVHRDLKPRNGNLL